MLAQEVHKVKLVEVNNALPAATNLISYDESFVFVCEIYHKTYKTDKSIS